MKTTSLPKFCLIGSLVLQAIVSIAILVLYRKHRNSITGLEDGGFYLGEGGKNSVFFITAIPPHVDETSGHLAMATGILTLLIGWAVTCFVVFANSHRKRWPCLLNPVYVFPFVFISTLLWIVTMISTLALHKASAHIDPNSQNVEVLREAYDSRFDLEAWTCDMARDISHGDLYTSQCQYEKAARGLVILGFVLAVFASVAAVKAFRGEREKWQSVIEAQKSRHRGFREEEYEII